MEFSKKQLANFKDALSNLWETDKKWYKLNSVNTGYSGYMGNTYHEEKILKTMICSPKENVTIGRICRERHAPKTFRKNHLYFVAIEHILMKSAKTGELYHNCDDIIYHTLSQFSEKSGLYPKWNLEIGYNIIDDEFDPYEAFNKYFDIIEEIVI
jgi:hypothetical protein